MWYKLFSFFSLKIFAKWNEINLSNWKCYDKVAYSSKLLVFEVFYNQSHSKCGIQLACIKEPRNRTFGACISILIRQCFQRCLILAYANLWRKKNIPLFYKHVAYKDQGHPTRNFDEISVRESLLVLRLSDNALTKSDWFLN